MRRLRLAVVTVMVVAGACSGADDVEGSGPGPSVTTSSTAQVAGAVETTSTTSQISSPEPLDSPFIHVSGDVAIPPGEPWKVSVVLVGPATDSTVPVVVRNRTASALTDVEVSGAARSAAGVLLASGSSQGMAPSVLRPGDWGFGYVFFGGAILPADARFDLTVTGRTGVPGLPLGKVDLTVAEVSRGTAFGTIPSIVGIVRNPTPEDVRGPVSVAVMCFSGGRATSAHAGFADGEVAVAGGTVSFSVNLFKGNCGGTFAVGASGWRF